VANWLATDDRWLSGRFGIGGLRLKRGEGGLSIVGEGGMCILVAARVAGSD